MDEARIADEWWACTNDFKSPSRFDAVPFKRELEDLPKEWIRTINQWISCISVRHFLLVFRAGAVVWSISSARLVSSIHHFCVDREKEISTSQDFASHRTISFRILEFNIFLALYISYKFLKFFYEVEIILFACLK